MSADSAEGVEYLLKDRISDVDDFAEAVRRVGNGGSALDPIIVSTLLSRQRDDDPLAGLAPREREVLELMAMGSSNQGIADKLVITLRAAEKYVSSIFGKLGLPSTGSESRRVLAVLMFLRGEPDEPRESHMSTDYDAIVIGARCGGSPTAMLLAGNGYRVLLVDKATFPSDTMSTHLAHPPAVAALDRWGILEQARGYSGLPPITEQVLVRLRASGGRGNAAPVERNCEGLLPQANRARRAAGRSRRRRGSRGA